jgi:hypothetical protein
MSGRHCQPSRVCWLAWLSNSQTAVGLTRSDEVVALAHAWRASVINSSTGMPEMQDRARSSAATACRWRPPAAGGGPDLHEACLLDRGLPLNVAQNVEADCSDCCVGRWVAHVEILFPGTASVLADAKCGTDRCPAPAECRPTC